MVRRAEPARLEVQNDYRRPLAEALTERLGHPQVDKLLIGHFSARYKDLKPLLDESKNVFKNTELACEGLVVEL